MKTIALAAAKGGVGKTTLAAALATAATMSCRGFRVCIADLDPQGSLTEWWNDRESTHPQLVSSADRPLAQELRAWRADGFHLAILDCPPGYANAIHKEAIALSNLVLVPTGPGPLDLHAVASTAQMAEGAGKPFRYVLNRAVCRSRIAGRAVEELRSRGGLLWPPVHNRVQISAAMAAGLTVLETKPDSVAAKELSDLWQAVRRLIDGIPEQPRARSTGGGRRS
ncbi:protein of unknown function [Rhodovastum atsumiense]|uniref:ParA family protein n=1 Tax=Rhodovastum atsumiense TaxID=504468 RepID=UPI00139F2B59|nr:ParA family protein [Rhodovastum atsumiense]CAH2603758.1 protein of unknown function [Rhodovastum atsumiense]